MKRKVSILLIITMIISMFTLSGCGVAEETTDKFEYRYYEDVGGAVITGYKGDSEKFRIPDKIDGYLVKKIGNGTFKGHSAIKEIVIPDGVTEIGEEAFLNCEGLTSITIPDSVITIYAGAFQGCTSLTSISIPDSVTELKGRAFMDCTNLSSIKLSNGIEVIDKYAFKNCTSLMNLTIPDGVKAISIDTFYGCKDITISYKGKQYTYVLNRGDIENEFYTAVNSWWWNNQ